LPWRQKQQGTFNSPVSDKANMFKPTRHWLQQKAEKLYPMKSADLMVLLDPWALG
jgi:hypothetical protein